MIIRRRQQHSFRRKFVRFTVAITTAAIFVFLVYFHSRIDAFSIGFRNLPSSYLNNNQVPKDPLPYAANHAPFSRLHTKDNSDDDKAPTIDFIDGNSGSGSSTPFFAEKLNLNRNADYDSNNNTPPFFGEKMDQSLENERDFTQDTQDRKIQNHPTSLASLSDRAENNDFIFQASVEKAMKSSDETEGTVKRVFNLVKSLPSKVGKTVKKTQNFIKDVQDISNEIDESVQESKQSIRDSMENTKQTISKRQQSIQKALSSVQNQKALNVAGKVSIGTLKIALWLGREVSLLAWIGSRSLYNNTIGPSVEENWNQQLDNLDNTVNRASTFVKNTPSIVQQTITSNVKRASTSVSRSTNDGNEPINMQTDPDLVVTAASAENEPAFVGRRKSEVKRKNNLKDNDRKNQSDDVNPLVKSILKNPAQLNKEREDAEKLANEISDALNMAERALSGFDQKTEDRACDDKNKEKKEAEKVANKFNMVGRVLLDSDQRTEGIANDDKNKESKETEKLANVSSDAFTMAERASLVSDINSEDMANDGKDKEIKETMILANKDSNHLSDDTACEGKNKERKEAKKLANKDALDMGEQAMHSSNHKSDDRATEKTESKEKLILKTPEDLNKELEKAQELAKEISNALDTAERAFKLKPNIELDDPMIKIDKPQSINKTEKSVTQRQPPPPPPPPGVVSEATSSIRKKKISRVEKREQRKAKRNATRARAKTQEDLDAELLEAQSLAKEIADALDIVEQALKRTPANTMTSDNDVDESLDDTTP